MPGMSDRKKPGVAFWATVAVVVPLLYVASFRRRVTFFATIEVVSVNTAAHVYFSDSRAAPTCSRVRPMRSFAGMPVKIRGVPIILSCVVTSQL